MGKKNIQDVSKFTLGCVGFLMCGMMCAMGCFLVYFLAVEPLLRQNEAMNWQETPCVVRELGIESQEFDKDGARRSSTEYSPKVEFEYTFNGQTHSSKQFWFSHRLFDTSSEVEALIRPYEKGGEYTCWVNPNDPSQAVLNRNVGSDSWVGWLAGGLFAVVGGIGCLASLWSLVRPSQSKKKSTSKTAKAMPIASKDDTKQMESSGAIGDQPTYYAVDVFPEEDDEPDEPLVLKQEYSRSVIAIGMWIFAVFWNGIIGLIFYVGRNDMPIPAMVFLSLFVLVGLAILWGAVYKTLQIWNPVTTVVCSQRFLYPGSEFEVSWMHQGNVSRIKSLKIILEGEESASYRQGTSTRTETKKFDERIIVDTTDPLQISQGFTLVELPPDTMHTFQAARNKIRRLIRVRGVIPFWPDIDDSYEVVIYPPKIGDGHAEN